LWLILLILAGFLTSYFTLVRHIEEYFTVVVLRAAILELFLMSVLIWQIVGLWRCARVGIRDGKVGLAWTARIFAIMLAIFGLFRESLAEPQFVAMWGLVGDEWSTPSVRTNGQKVTFVGLITPKSAGAVVAALDQPGITQLWITSRGGSALSGARIRNAVERHHVEVVADAECASACIMIWASAARRAVGNPPLPLMFHRVQFFNKLGRMYFPEAVAESEREDRMILRRAGANDAFIARAMSPQTDQALYRASLQDLIKGGLNANVIDREGVIMPLHLWCARHPKECAMRPLV